MPGIADENELVELEQQHADGLSLQQVVAACAERGERLTEATFRKYVQLGLLRRSVRVGRKGKHRGSQGLYPASTVRQLLHIRQLMRQGLTIEEIQRRSLLLRGDIDALDANLERIFVTVAQAANEVRVQQGPVPLGPEELEEARAHAVQLIDALRGIESRLSMHMRMERAAV